MCVGSIGKGIERERFKREIEGEKVKDGESSERASGEGEESSERGVKCTGEGRNRGKGNWAPRDKTKTRAGTQIKTPNNF